MKVEEEASADLLLDPEKDPVLALSLPEPLIR